jgi:hypothetical protein
MLECFKIRVVSPCSRGQTRASSATQKQSRERLDGQNDDQDEPNKDKLANNEREVDDREDECRR